MTISLDPYGTGGMPLELISLKGKHKAIHTNTKALDLAPFVLHNTLYNRSDFCEPNHHPSGRGSVFASSTKKPWSHHHHHTHRCTSWGSDWVVKWMYTMSVCVGNSYHDPRGKKLCLTLLSLWWVTWVGFLRGEIKQQKLEWQKLQDCVLGMEKIRRQVSTKYWYWLTSEICLERWKKFVAPGRRLKRRSKYCAQLWIILEYLHENKFVKQTLPSKSS